MTNATNIHPDFLKALTSAQDAWLRSNGIKATKGARYGFYFSRGERWIAPIAATDSSVYVMTHDRSEDGDGEKCLRTFPRLRDALKYLAAAPDAGEAYSHH